VESDLEGISRRNAEWLEHGRQALIDELGRRLSLAISLRRPDRPTLESAVTTAAAAEWPTEIIGFWIAALRMTGASWDDVGDLLGTSRQAAHRRFAPWERRYRPFLLAAIAQPVHHPHTPANRLQARAQVLNTSDVDDAAIDALRGVADADARSALPTLYKQPPE